jgi:hypothetical protein
LLHAIRFLTDWPSEHFESDASTYTCKLAQMFDKAIFCSHFTVSQLIHGGRVTKALVCKATGSRPTARGISEIYFSNH